MESHKVSCKPARVSSEVTFPTVESMRTALVIRSGDDSPPGAWRSAAAAAGVSGADAFMCHLSRSIATALECLSSSAEAVRVRLQSLREAVCGLDYSHCDDLDARVTSTESLKRTALELELCAVDAVLERWRAERETVAEMSRSLGDAELMSRHAELSARLDTVEAELSALPTTVIEPPYVGLLIDEPALLTGMSAFGRVVVPRAVTAANLILEGSPYHAWPGCSLHLRLVLQGVRHEPQSSEELKVSLVAAALATHVDAFLEASGASLLPLKADTTADVSSACLCVAIGVPVSASIGSSVCFGPLTVSGRPVAGLPDALTVQPPCPADLSPGYAFQLQEWLPAGGSSSPSAWVEVYRATTDGFGASAFHTRCDGRTRLLVLVRAQEDGWLFGGFTAVGFRPPERLYADPAAFLFSLTNSLGHPEKLESNNIGEDLYYHPDALAVFGHAEFGICNQADTVTESQTIITGQAFAVPASTGAHPMAQGDHMGWLAAEVVAWVV